MRAYDVIAKKRDGQPISLQEIDFIVGGYVQGSVPDYQMAAFLMAVYFRGMDQKEIAHLTKVMLDSGQVLDLSSIKALKADKHSTGGVGDKVTLVLAPLVAAGGVIFPKMSGKGLGHTGGTIDKLEAIPGLVTELSSENFIKQVQEINLAVVGQTGNLVPADKKIYALRDVTATVNSIPLIASSIMSKKLAAGADRIVLDVKVGSGAFMQELEEAKMLAETMVRIGRSFGKHTVAIISNMDQPLGRSIGNSLEMIEALETLKGRGPNDLTQLTLKLAGEIFYLVDQVADSSAGYQLAKQILYSGTALKKMQQLIEAQNGKSKVIEDYSLLPLARYRKSVPSPHSGYVSGLDARLLGQMAMELGAGRVQKEDRINYGVGLIIKKKVSDMVLEGEELVEVFTDDIGDVPRIWTKIQQAFNFSKEKVEPSSLIYERIE